MGRAVIGSSLRGAILVWATAACTPLHSALFIRGDIDVNRTHDVTDAVLLLNHMFLGNPTVLDCEDAADVDDTGVLDLSDAVYLLNFLFLGGPTPPQPFPRCGLDHTGDFMECLSYPPCPSFCGGFPGFPCGEGEVCDLALGFCDGADLPGTCVILPEVCPEVFEPVCGCDGVTYGNDCLRLRAGVQKRSDGECAEVKRCGGLLGEQCAEDEVCDLPPGECKVADLQGECVARPEACPPIFEPVCGCDGVTYPSDCDRLMAGVQKDHDGECQEVKRCSGTEPCARDEVCDFPAGFCGVEDLSGECVARPVGCPDVFDPVCGCDGVTYSNDCDRLMAGVQKDHDGECQPATACGGIQGTPCAKGEFCDLPEGSCDVVDLEGECVPVVEGCPKIFQPVCGCDGQTYGNDCERIRAGVQKAHEGECGATRLCGGIAGLPCASIDEFCEFPEGTCGAADETGECVIRGVACPAIFDPVCGCDGVTYSNDCVRRGAGVSLAHQGPCEQ